MIVAAAAANTATTMMVEAKAAAATASLNALNCPAKIQMKRQNRAPFDYIIMMMIVVLDYHFGFVLFSATDIITMMIDF